jgi:copper chaperone CopZ
MITKFRASLLAVVALLATAITAQAAAPAVTRITVEELHCAGCARQVATKLQKIPGVAKVEMNLKAKMMFVTPRPQVVLSPRALWEAVEKAEEKPVKLEGPTGTFTAKPQS